MTNIKCKDYFIFKLRYYADRSVLDRFGPSHPQHSERARLSSDFFWAFTEKVTGKKQDVWYAEYMFGTRECATEELAADFGIFIFLLSEGCYTYFIPLNHKEIINWIIPNIHSPYKILKKTSVGFVNTDKNQRWKRDRGKKFTDDWKQKIFIQENTRKILVEKDENRPNKKRVNQFKDL